MATDFPDGGSRDSPSPGSSPSTPAPTGLTIGNYRLIERIGEGGVGEVYVAEQVRPIRRRVALKIIKRGMDTEEFIERFESERQALALMDHPFIAKVFDAGRTERGRPYLVMEYVPGVPITRHCNEHRLGVRERLELFILVCEGIQHAHQKAIIHRDIKPSNVLVTKTDEATWPKIIDFGIAKALGAKLTEHTIQTAMGQILGTPEYMSPEQADLVESAIDTRTDIYLLGVLLYVLLTDVLPFDAEEMRRLGLQGMLYRIRSVDPPRPSARVAALGEAAVPIAAARNTTPQRLAAGLCADLDWITMTALEKEPAKRYQTVHALITDIRHHLRDEPVVAGPPSTAYRVRKFVKRHRLQVIAASMVLAALVLGLGGTIYGLVKTTRAEGVARHEAATARQVSDFLVGLFEVVDPGEALGNSITAREILDAGVAKIEADLAGEPRIQARLMNTMGKVYNELGLYGAARPLLERSLATMEQLRIHEEPEAAMVMDDLGGLLRRAGSYEESRRVLERSLAVRAARLGREHPEVGHSLNSLGNLYWETGDLRRAESIYQRALLIREAHADSFALDLAVTLNNLGGVRMQIGDYAGARPYLERALAIREAALRPNHPDVAFSLDYLGTLHWRSGSPARAREYYERCLRIREEVLGAGHPLVGQTLANYGITLEELGEYAGARQAYDRALAIYGNELDADHPHVADTLNNLAILKVTMGDPSGRADADSALAIRERVFGAASPEAAAALTTSGVVLMAAGEDAEALARFERAFAIGDSGDAAASLETAKLLMNRGLARGALGDVPGARGDLERGLAMAEALVGPDHPRTAEVRHALGSVLLDAGEFAAARAHLDRALATRTAALGADAPETAGTMAAIGLLLYFEERFDEARDIYTRALAIQVRRLPSGSPELANSGYNLACLCAKQGDTEEALQHLRLAAANGLADPYIAEDADLAVLRGDPDFEAIVRRVLAAASGR